MKITDYLNHGADRAQTGKQLCDILHVSGRELAELIRQARLAGQPVCSKTTTAGTGRSGYYLGQSADELSDTIRSLRNREKALKKARQALEKTRKRLYSV